MSSHNIYGIGAPKSGGTSLSEWLNLNTKMRVYPHDAIADEKIGRQLSPNVGEVWCGGSFWLARSLHDLDPSGLQILAVRHTVFDWAQSFWLHFHRVPKFGPGRVQALHPVLELNNGTPIAGPNFRPSNAYEEQILLQHTLNINKIYFQKGDGVCLSLEGMEDILRAYVPHHVDLAQRTDNDDKYIVINIAKGLTPTQVLHEWLTKYVPMSDSMQDAAWPHKRKTAEGTLKASLAEEPNAIEEIQQLCDQYEQIWQDEVISRILTGVPTD
tara:strand:+ start:1445 stop:2254 length:810 start_codon:yes stop_codon:yes gene_type:complete